MRRLLLAALFVAGCDDMPPDRIRVTVVGSISLPRARVVVECTEGPEQLSYVFSADGAMTVTCARSNVDAGGSR